MAQAVYEGKIGDQVRRVLAQETAFSQSLDHK
jgi:hypothetical protein